MKTGKWRHELKYTITMSEYLGMRSCISEIMHHDTHSDGKPYVIESLYFDGLGDKALKEKIFGVNEREKFRIRLYNGDTSFIKLEKKQKKDGLCLKTAAVITEDMMYDMIDGTMALPEGSLEREFYVKRRAAFLVPKTIVRYRRDAFIYTPGNVRVTFDSDLRTGMYSHEFPLKDTGVPAVKPGTIVLEIKYDEFLPDAVRDAVQAGYPRLQAFSKYAACRAFE